MAIVISPVGMRLIFPPFKRWFPASAVPPVSSRHLASTCAICWSYGNSAYWMDIQPDLYWRTCPDSVRREWVGVISKPPPTLRLAHGERIYR